MGWALRSPSPTPSSTGLSCHRYVAASTRSAGRGEARVTLGDRVSRVERKQAGALGRTEIHQ